MVASGCDMQPDTTPAIIANMAARRRRVSIGSRLRETDLYRLTLADCKFVKMFTEQLPRVCLLIVMVICCKALKEI